MRRQELITRVGEAARARTLSWEKVREGRRHEIWQCGATRVSIPSHREINEHTAHGIFKDLEDELGERWWR